MFLNNSKKYDQPEEKQYFSSGKEVKNNVNFEGKFEKQ